MTLYVSSTNLGKLRDFAHAAEAYRLNNEAIHIEPFPNLAQIPAPPEDEPTFEGNARAKAIYYSQHAPNALVLADDSGLEVTSLANAPGVRSARYADDVAFPHPPASTTDSRNNAALLHALSAVPENSRQARYRCVLALARSNGREAGEVLQTAEGFLEGVILTTPRGTLGFGYDPLFLIPHLNQTMAELDPTTRLSLSHRGHALRNILTQDLKRITENTEQKRE